MKKLLKKLLCGILVVSSFGFATACSEKLTKIEILNLEDFESVAYGGVINWNNLKLKATYSNGKILTLKYGEIKNDLDINLGNFRSTQAGEYNIELSYKDKSCSFEIEVKEPVVSGIGIERIGLAEVINIEKITTEFKADFENKIAVKAYKTDGSATTLSKTDYLLVNYDNSTKDFSNALDVECLNDVGEHWFAVKYGEFTPIIFSVRVKLGDENGFVLGLGEISQEISVGDEVDFSKVKVYATYTDGRQILLNSSDYSIDTSAFDNSKTGNYAIIVSYKHYLNKTFYIEVKE